MIIPHKTAFPQIIYAAHSNERYRVEQMRASLYAHEEWYRDRGEDMWARLMYDAGLDVDKIATERWPDWQGDAYLFFKVRIPKVGKHGFE